MTHFFKIVLMLVFTIGAVQARSSSTPDYQAGYDDGCSSAKGHYTRSAYKYRHSSRYHSGWLKGKKGCVKRKVTKRKVRRHRTKKTYYKSCNSEVPWTAFRRGWNHGNRSAKGRFYVDRRGCAAYRQGWVNGYRDCHCGDLKKPDSYAEGYYAGCVSVSSFKIRDDYYYTTRSGYRHGWIQGYKDCRGIYR
jgi:hypothetical protein